MATKVNVIITENTVYATYVETICFKGSFTNEKEKWEQIDKAKISAFSYAISFGNVLLDMITISDLMSDNDIFDYLKKIHTKH
jgi:hypothetical protein